MLRERLQRDADASTDADPRRQPDHPARRRHDLREPEPSFESGPRGEMAEAFLHFPDAVVLVDGSGTIVWGNLAAERIFGRTLDEWVGRSGLDLVHPDDHEFVLRSLSSVQGKEVGSPIEIRVSATSGWRLIEMIGTRTHWSGEDVVLLSMRDLTERRRYEVASGRGEATFRSLVHNAGSIIMLVSNEGNLESVSGAITRLLGHDPELLEGRPLADIVAGQDQAEFLVALAAARRGATAVSPVIARVGLRRHDGGDVPFELNFVNLLEDPTVEGIVVTAHDVAAQVTAEREVGDALSRLTATLDSTADGILVIDVEGRITDFNRRFSDIWGLPEDGVSRQDDMSNLRMCLEQLIRPQDFVSRIEDLDADPENEFFDLLEFKDGRVIERFARSQIVDGEVLGRVYSFRDVTDRKVLEDELAYRAFHDSLTRLANKALFQDRLEHALTRMVRKDSHLAVLFLDLDDFKTVNDSLGHGEGDQLLRRVATTLVDLLQPSDTAARLGGDEFAVLMEDVPSREAVEDLAQKILESLRLPVRLGTKTLSGACSIGIAFDEEGITSEQLLRNADIAMYQAKKRGKDRFEEYRPEMHTFVLARIELEEELRAAISSGDLIAYYQPQLDLRNNRVVGFEALVRWPHPEGVLVDPRHFVPLATEIGLIGEIDSCVMRAACRQVREWVETGICGPDLEIGVNLSAGQLVDELLSDRIAATLRECEFEPTSLVIEITESEVLTDDAATLQNIAALRKLGVRIALDDFGTGYSTFLHLLRLPVDIVKIDKSFVDMLGQGEDDSRSMAAALIQLARTLGYATIAEGVETAAQLESLRLMGCDLAQGYHLGRPLEAKAARWLLGAHDLQTIGTGESLTA
ncbi:MAG TPA: EAL domain-containing protein [Acidimicrobiales bacterium]|jgi:diguanylate cyclase (GGDEF)-like protein/PAS domain S-box-containing protein|nr:EAL domain-containing protein [Acidimicrobiales bacterium]